MYILWRIFVINLLTVRTITMWSSNQKSNTIKEILASLTYQSLPAGGVLSWQELGLKLKMPDIFQHFYFISKSINVDKCIK